MKSKYIAAATHLPPCPSCGADYDNPCQTRLGRNRRPHIERTLNGRGLWILTADCDWDEEIGHREIPPYMYGWIERADWSEQEGIEVWFVNGAAIRLSLPELLDKRRFILDAC